MVQIHQHQPLNISSIIACISYGKIITWPQKYVEITSWNSIFGLLSIGIWLLSSFGIIIMAIKFVKNVKAMNTNVFNFEMSVPVEVRRRTEWVNTVLVLFEPASPHQWYGLHASNSQPVQSIYTLWGEVLQIVIRECH